MMIYEGNQINHITVQTPVGPTEKFEAPTILTQGGPLAPLICGTQTDTIGKKAQQRSEYLYKYKNKVEISPMEMIDDVATVSKCGIDSVDSLNPLF